MKLKRQEKQLSFPGFNRNTKKSAHGGEHTLGKRKGSRPFDPKQAIHVVLRSSQARGALSMLHPSHCNHIERLVNQLKLRWGIAVYRYANVGNHLHLLIRAKSRANWQGFIRELSGRIAMIVTGARKGNALLRSKTAGPESAKRGFWDYLVFTRLVSFGRDFKNVARYVATNLWEGLGIPVREYLARGFRILDLHEEGGILIHSRASPEIIAALQAKI
jgi:REP element-mobilizing transposase RayT